MYSLGFKLDTGTAGTARLSGTANLNATGSATGSGTSFASEDSGAAAPSARVPMTASDDSGRDCTLLPLRQTPAVLLESPAARRHDHCHRQSIASFLLFIVRPSVHPSILPSVGTKLKAFNLFNPNLNLNSRDDSTPKT